MIYHYIPLKRVLETHACLYTILCGIYCVILDITSHMLVHFTLYIPSVCIIITSPCVCIKLTSYMYDSTKKPVITLCLLVLRTKYSLTLLLSLTVLNIIFDPYESHK